MSDIRFKISGDSAPFVAKICNTGCNVVLQQNVIEYSGSCYNSCNIFGNLYPNTSYTLNITDNIGNSISCSYSTPVQVGTSTLGTKNICLSGTSYQGVVYSCYLTNNVIIAPSLSAGETLTLCFQTCTVGGSSYGVNSNVSISCWQNGGSGYNPIVNRTNDGTFNAPSIILCCGDKLCYNLSTVRIDPLIHGVPSTNLNGCAVLKLINAIPNGFIANVINTGLTTSVTYTTTTLAPTTTQSPIVVYFGGVSNNAVSSEDVYLCGKICTSPPLTSGQSFRLCYTTHAHSCSDNMLPKPIIACSYLYIPNSVCNLSNSNVGMTTGDCNCGPNSSWIDVNSSNIGTITLCVRVDSHGANNSIDYINCATLYPVSISNIVGGNIILNDSECLWAYSTYTRNGVLNPASWSCKGVSGGGGGLSEIV